jgi:hypothetical protein
LSGALRFHWLAIMVAKHGAKYQKGHIPSLE